MAVNSQKKQYVEEENNQQTLSIKDFVFMCLSKWYWFVASFAIVMTLAVAYILVKEPSYTRSSQVLIKSGSEGSSISNAVGEFSNLGLFSTNSNVYNELIAINSPSVMMEVVERLQLNMRYKTDGTFHKKTIYGSNLPINVKFLDMDENTSAKVEVDIDENGVVTLSEFVMRIDDEKFKSDEVVTGLLIEPMNTPIGRIAVTPTLQWEEGKAHHIYVSKNGLHSTAQACQKKLEVTLDNKDADVINLSYIDVSPQRAVDVLNEIINVYNEKWLDDKNKVTVSTSRFIAERLDSIVKELGDVDESISSYKSQQLLPDMAAATNMYMSQSSKHMEDMFKINNELAMAKYILNYVRKDENRRKLLPANSGLSSNSVESQIAEYNAMQLRLSQLSSGGDVQNPVIADLEASLESTRGAIEASVENLVVSLETQLKNLKQNEAQTTSRIAANPGQEKYLLTVGRQQKVKEALYLYLLQKREENELTRAFTADNTRIITPPMGELRPTSPGKMKILFVAFVLALLIPCAYIFLRESLITTVRSRRDLARLSVPMIGEIPLHGKSASFWNKKVGAGNVVVVQEGNRDIINEAFRVLRTNVELMTHKDESRVIVVTSFNPGSGKSFLVMNVAKSLALKGKRVLVIDGDLRHASASAYVDSPRRGLSSYLVGVEEDLSSLVVKSSYDDNLWVLPVGIIPPNPTELLESERLAQCFETIKGEYDYVFVDCPPIDIVADTQIIERFATRTFFVVRAGLLEKNILPELEEIYQGGRFKNLSLILNATTDDGGGRYGSRYGYPYGANYYEHGAKANKKNK
ncbi:MAG: polysaccharide biosynthesis tyrosine autokinase [Muribaculaceae bacterium]|nr:polysaccharide biosynthesis tyrosine autokinase [Muribaculaceae bacterium]